MKSKLRAALVAAGCVLAVSPANAISVTINPMNTVTTSVPGAVLFDDFDSIQNAAIGTIIGGFVHGPAPNGPGSPPVTGNFIVADGALCASLNVAVMLTDPCQLRWLCFGNAGPHE
jgi:hypothetical protein